MIINNKVLVKATLSKEDEEIIKTAANTLGLILNEHNPEDILVNDNGNICTLQDLSNVLSELMRIVKQLPVEK